METVNIADAKARLSELADRAAGGEEIQLTKRGKPLARIVPIQGPRKSIDIEALRKLTERMKANGAKPGSGAGKLVREMRDQERY